MAYSSYESTKAPSTCPLVIMHGLLGSKSNWRSLSKSLHAKTGRKVVAVDARNHGDSPHDDHLSYNHLAEDVRALLTDLKIDQSVLLGHSMGGRAMMLAALLNVSTFINLNDLVFSRGNFVRANFRFLSLFFLSRVFRIIEEETEFFYFLLFHINLKKVFCFLFIKITFFNLILNSPEPVFFDQIRHLVLH